MKRQIFSTFWTYSLFFLATTAFASDPVLKPTDQIRFTWVKITSNEATDLNISLDIQLCAFQRIVEKPATDPKVYCQTITAFKSKTATAGKTTEFENLTSKFEDGADILKLAQALADHEKFTDPVFTLRLILSQQLDGDKTQRLVTLFAGFPKLTLMPKDPKKSTIIPHNVYLEKTHLNSTVTIELKREQ